MSNDNENFFKYVSLCLQNRDSLLNNDELIKFAKNQDWDSRFYDYKNIIEKVYPSVDIIILSYNNKYYTKLCYESIINNTAYPNYRIIIVDNDSEDGSKEYIKSIKNDKVISIINENNLGFSGGNNEAIKISKSDYILLLNNDTIVTRGWLNNLVKHMENDTNIGMCGPVTNSIGNEAKIEIDYNNILEANKFSFEYTQKNMGKLNSNIKVLALFCTIIRKEVIEKCGYLDTNYKVGMFEDDDYSQTIKNSGYKIMLAEDSYIHHFEGVSFKKLNDDNFLKIYDENKKYFEKKWNKKWEKHSFRYGVNCDTNYNNNFSVKKSLEENEFKK